MFPQILILNKTLVINYDNMKNLKILILAITGMALWSCQKDETIATLNASGATSSLKASTASLAIDESMIANTVITFNLTEPNFGFQAAVTNVLQISTKADNFAVGKVKEFALDSKTFVRAYKGVDFNNILLSLSIPTTANTDIVVRTKSSISSSVAPVYSNVLTISARPFPLTAWVYLPGAYQGWNPSTADSLVSLTGNGIYTGVIFLDGGNFKVTPAKKWDVAYGSTGGNGISTTGGDIASGVAGPKFVTVDLNANTIDIKNAVTVSLWSIVGDATPGGWGTDTNLKSLNDGKNTWRTTVNLVAGKLKFRFKNDWSTNLGGPLGALTLGGDDIVITTSGSYTITLTVAQNDSADPTKTTGGSATIVRN